MFKAGALLYVILISFILSILTGIFILSIYYSQIQVVGLVKMEELNDDIESALNVYISDSEKYTAQKQDIDLYGDGEHNVSLSVKRWGLYEIVQLSSKWKSSKLSKTVLMGQDIRHNENIALYYTDVGNKLTLCGKTLIEGNVYSPNGIIERGYIEGKGFDKEKLLNGELKSAEYNLPELSESYFELYDELKKASDETLFDIHNYNDYVREKGLVENSFTNKTLFLYLSNDIEIEGNSFSGNIIISSEEDIIITKESKLQDVILFCKNLKIEEGFKGNMQVFASNGIIVGKECKMVYPTVFCVNGNDKIEILIGENTNVLGDIIGYTSDVGNSSHILISSGAKIQGEIYTNTTVEHKGIIHGTLFCAGIELNTKTAINTGYLMDCEINYNKLPVNYSRSIPFEKKANKKKIKNLK